MTKYERLEKQTKGTKRHLKKCDIADRWIKFGFGKTIVNSQGKCGGCYNPDDQTLEPECKECPYNEYFVETEIGV